MRKLRRVMQLSFAEWHYLATASMELLVARIVHLAFSSQAILQDLQKGSPSQSCQAHSQEAVIDVKRLSWAIAVASSHVPWRSDCLIQAIAARRWLRRYGLSGDFYLGVAKDPKQGLKAHAWLCLDDLTITGGNYAPFSPLIKPLAE